MTTYHERVAARMKATHAAGSMNSYETILEALYKKYPTEPELRALVDQLETYARLFEPGFVFLEDEQ